MRADREGGLQRQSTENVQRRGNVLLDTGMVAMYLDKGVQTHRTHTAKSDLQCKLDFHGDVSM